MTKTKIKIYLFENPQKFDLKRGSQTGLHDAVQSCLKTVGDPSNFRKITAIRKVFVSLLVAFSEVSKKVSCKSIAPPLIVELVGCEHELCDWGDEPTSEDIDERVERQRVVL